jgi:hypothetical protein
VIAGVIPGQKTDDSALEIMEVTPWWAACKADKTINFIESGIPEFRHEFPPHLREYFQFREHLYTIDGVILYTDIINIPPSLREEVLSALHAAHQGVTSMISRAESSVSTAPFEDLSTIGQFEYRSTTTR